MVTGPDEPLDPDAGTPALLRHTAELATRFREGLPERRVGPDRAVGADELRAALGGPLPEQGEDAAGDRSSGSPGRPIPGWSAWPGRATSASSSAARCRPRSPPTGSPSPGTRTPASTSCSPAAVVVEEWRPAGCWSSWACPPASGRLRDRRHDGELHRARRRTSRRPRSGAAGTSRSTDSTARRAIAVVVGDEAHVTIARWRSRCSASAANASKRSPADGRAGWSPRRCARARGLRWAADRLRAGGQREHRRVRSARRDRRPPSARGRRLAPRRRRVRPVGGGGPGAARICSTASSAPTPGRPTRHKWLNVPYDCGHRVRRATRRAPGGDDARRAVPRPDRRATSATRFDCVPEFSRRARGFAV